MSLVSSTEKNHRRPKEKNSLALKLLVSILALILAANVRDHDPALLSMSYNETGALYSPKATGLPTIPYRLVFTYKENLLLPEVLSRQDGLMGSGNLARNVNRTIRMFRDAWKNKTDNVEVDFYTNEDCIRMLQETEPRLVKPFMEEKVGAHKSDICRVVALWQTGGYYFDNDLVTVRIPLLSTSIEFSTVATTSLTEFFQAFTAVAPRHPIMNLSMQVMMDVYEGRRAFPGHMGTRTMRDAFDLYISEFPEKVETVQLFHERCLLDHSDLLTEHPREQGGCYPPNFVVLEAETGKLIFESRLTDAIVREYGLDIASQS